MADAPEDLADIRRDLERALGLIAKKAPDYELAREFYDGTRAEQASSKAAETIIRQAKDTPLSFAHIPVDVIADKVELASITGTGSAAKRALETWGDANDLDDESVDWIRKACMFGDYYVVTDPTGLDLDGVGVGVQGDREAGTQKLLLGAGVVVDGGLGDAEPRGDVIDRVAAVHAQ